MCCSSSRPSGAGAQAAVEAGVDRVDTVEVLGQPYLVMTAHHALGHDVDDDLQALQAEILHPDVPLLHTFGFDRAANQLHLIRLGLPQAIDNQGAYVVQERYDLGRLQTEEHDHAAAEQHRHAVAARRDGQGHRHQRRGVSNTLSSRRWSTKLARAWMLSRPLKNSFSVRVLLPAGLSWRAAARCASPARPARGGTARRRVCCPPRRSPGWGCRSPRSRTPGRRVP